MTVRALRRTVASLLGAAAPCPEELPPTRFQAKDESSKIEAVDCLDSCYLKARNTPDQLSKGEAEGGRLKKKKATTVTTSNRFAALATEDGETKAKESEETVSEAIEKNVECGGGYVKLGTMMEDAAEDTGIQTSRDSKFIGISASFDSFGNAGKDLGVQYQAKYEKDVECGGGYVKLGTMMKDATAFGDPTVYNFMGEIREEVKAPMDTGTSYDMGSQLNGDVLADGTAELGDGSDWEEYIPELDDDQRCGSACLEEAIARAIEASCKP